MPQAALKTWGPRGLLIALAAPWLLLVGLGVHNAPGGWIEGALLRVLAFSSDPVAFVDLLGHVGVGLIGLCAAGLFVVGAQVVEDRFAATRGLTAIPESAVLLAGLIAWSGVFAVGAGLDRPLFWGGVALMALAGVQRVAVDRWTALENGRWRLVLLIAAGAAVLLAGTTLLEGPGQHSPPFRLRNLWVHGPGQDGVASGGVWLAVGLATAAALRRRRARIRLVPAALITVAVLVTQGGTATHVTIAAGVSALGLLIVAWHLPPLFAWVPRVDGGLDVLDPRRLFGALLPVLLWAGLCAARGLTVFMWTVPSTLPPGVTQLAQHADVFSLDVDPASGAVVYTDREASLMGVLVDGQDRQFDLGATGPEEILVTGPGVVQVSLIADQSSGVVAVDLEEGPRVPARAIPGGCWIAGLFPIPESAAAAAGLPEGSFAVGCEGEPSLWLVKQPLEVAGRKQVPHPVEEAAFDPSGTSLYTVDLWRGSDVTRLSWPALEAVDRRTIGGFNWTVVHDDARDRLWVGRFFEGNLLALDAATLEVVETVRLSFGIRAMVHEPVHDRLWVAAAYSGRIWSVSAADPSDRRAYALCGQSRALVATGDGAVVVATDCGVWRIEEAAE